MIEILSHSSTRELRRSTVKIPANLGPPELVFLPNPLVDQGTITSLRLEFTNMVTWVGIQFIELYDLSGNLLTPGVDWVGTAQDMYSTGYPTTAPYSEGGSYWCSRATTGSCWYQITLSTPQQIGRLVVHRAYSYRGGTFELLANGELGSRELIHSEPELPQLLNIPKTLNNRELEHDYFNNWSLKDPINGAVTQFTSGTQHSITIGLDLPSGSVWGRLFGSYVTSDSNLHNAFIQSLWTERTIAQRPKGRILIRFGGRIQLQSFKGEDFNGISSHDYSAYSGVNVLSFVFFDPITQWYVDYNPYEGTLKRFDPTRDLEDW